MATAWQELMKTVHEINGTTPATPQAGSVDFRGTYDGRYPVDLGDTVALSKISDSDTLILYNRIANKPQHLDTAVQQCGAQGLMVCATLSDDGDVSIDVRLEHSDRGYPVKLTEYEKETLTEALKGQGREELQKELARKREGLDFGR